MSEQPYRADWDAHRAQVRAANRARYRAVRRMIAEDPVTWDRLYAEEAAKDGVKPVPMAPVEDGQLELEYDGG